MRKHIKEQIKARINTMNPVCYAEGSCVACGCHTTALQMSNLSCERHCYPKMYSKEDWDKLLNGHIYIYNETKWKAVKYANGYVEFRIYRDE